jgi:hypothetical protein
MTHHNLELILQPAPDTHHLTAGCNDDADSDAAEQWLNGCANA